MREIKVSGDAEYGMVLVGMRGGSDQEVPSGKITSVCFGGSQIGLSVAGGVGGT